MGSRKNANPIHTSGVMYVDGNINGMTRHRNPKMTKGQKIELGSLGYEVVSSPGNRSDKVS